MNSLLISALPGLLVGVCVGILSYFLSLRRFYSQRWWEKKAEIYSKVIESLYHILNYHELLISEDFNPSNKKQENERQADHAAKSEAAIEEIDKIIAIGRLIISKPAVDRLISLKESIEDSSTAPDWFQHLEEVASAVHESIEDMLSLAKKELRVR